VSANIRFAASLQTERIWQMSNPSRVNDYVWLANSSGWVEVGTHDIEIVTIDEGIRVRRVHAQHDLGYFPLAVTSDNQLVSLGSVGDGSAFWEGVVLIYTSLLDGAKGEAKTIILGNKYRLLYSGLFSADMRAVYLWAERRHWKPRIIFDTEWPYFEAFRPYGEKELLRLDLGNGKARVIGAFGPLRDMWQGVRIPNCREVSFTDSGGLYRLTVDLP
jgi:hypothetical protein